MFFNSVLLVLALTLVLLLLLIWLFFLSTNASSDCFARNSHLFMVVGVLRILCIYHGKRGQLIVAQQILAGLNIDKESLFSLHGNGTISRVETRKNQLARVWILIFFCSFLLCFAYRYRLLISWSGFTTHSQIIQFILKSCKQISKILPNSVIYFYEIENIPANIKCEQASKYPQRNTQKEWHKKKKMCIHETNWEKNSCMLYFRESHK